MKLYMKTIALLLFLHLLSGAAGLAQGYKRSYKPIHSGSYVQDKNFYLLTLFEQVPGVRQAMAADTLLQRVNRQVKQQLSAAACTDIKCHSARYQWPDQQAEQIGRELNKLAATNKTMQWLVQSHLRPSGYFSSAVALNDGDLMEKAWLDAARGINHIIEVYALGQKPLYPDIDSLGYPARSATYNRLINIISVHIVESRQPGALFFEPSLQYALDLLEVNNRDEAARFEPMTAGENAPAIRYIKTLDWKKYPYTVMMVPGAGNDMPNVPLAAWGKMRLKIAAERYKKGLAPVIIVSGGYVHPFQTPFCEALEMKKYLIAHYGIPAKAILLEPHARHTTTNIRNAARLIFTCDIPTDKPGLIVTDQGQSAMIESKSFAERNLKELKYIPYQKLKRISIYDLEFMPSIYSMAYDATDPLDP